MPLGWWPALVEKAQRACHAAAKAWQAAFTFMGWVGTQLDDVGRLAQRILFGGDGSFDHIHLWKARPERVIGVVRTAKNRALYKRPGLPGGRGAPRQYGDRALTPEAWLKQRAGWQTVTWTVRGRQRRMVYRLEGLFLRPSAPACPLFLFVVRGQTWKRRGSRGRRKACFYLVNAVEQEGHWVRPLPTETRLFWAWQRWELDVAHPEDKSGLGIADKQCWHPRSAVTSVQCSAWLYSLLRLAAYRTWGFTHHPRTPLVLQLSLAGAPCRLFEDARIFATAVLVPDQSSKKSPLGDHDP